MMIPYHGLPITPDTVAVHAISGGHAFVSFAHPEQLSLALDYAQSFAVDNGAFTAWKQGKPVTDWRDYYEWVGELHRYPSFDFAVIPDVIDGSESDNDALLEQWPWKAPGSRHIGSPVWHLHESLDRLNKLALQWPRICLGSSGNYATVGTYSWWNRMFEAMDVVCDKQGLPITKLHGLRMLNPDVFTRFPLASADSTNIARNIKLDSQWKGTYRPPTNSARAIVMRQRIESFQSLAFWERQKFQRPLFMEVV